MSADQMKICQHGIKFVICRYLFQDLGQVVCQAREAQDIEAVDDWFADSISEMQRQQTALLRQ